MNLRAWQAQFDRQLAAHPRDDFLLVACPAAGKTVAAGVGAAHLMAQRDCDQLVVVSPTVVVRDQWQLELGRLGYRMLSGSPRTGWPEHVHGVCTTYAQVGARADVFAAACAARRTVVIFDEIHHAGEQLAWGEAIEAFAGALFRLALSGTPFRSDQDRIPFVRYDDDGRCLADFAYDYPRAVRDGVCRPVEFRAHDGKITWLDDGAPRSASFSEPVDRQARAKRLRASLDPTQPYLRSMLEAAHADLVSLREEVPDAAALVVCDSQAHALEVDRVLSEIIDELPVIAISDLPRAHQAIQAFADGSTQWLVSVRMVAEGVDIPRLGVIVWVTSASTELMVRQVAGRALRGREGQAMLPAAVHIPADPRLVEYARRLDVLGGVSLRSRARRRDESRERPPTIGLSRSARRIDPRPFVEWFDGQASAVGVPTVLSRCGWKYETGLRALHRWRCEGADTSTLTMLDACHMADLDFDVLFAGPEYLPQRAFARDPDLAEGRQSLRAVEATPCGVAPAAIAPPLPKTATPGVYALEPIEIATPELPLSPEELKAAEEARERSRGDLFRLLSVYVQLRRRVDPAYQPASAHAELAAAVGAVTAGSSDEHVDEALAWIRETTSQLGRAHPEHVLDLARERRRLAIGREATA